MGAVQQYVFGPLELFTVQRLLFLAHRGGVGFLSHLRSLTATMSQKSSVPQPASFVSVVLKRRHQGRSATRAARFRPVPIPHTFELIGFRSELFGKLAEHFLHAKFKELTRCREAASGQSAEINSIISNPEYLAFC